LILVLIAALMAQPAAQPTLSLDDIQKLAYADLSTNVLQEDWLHTRYLSLHAARNPETLISSLLFVLNSTSFRTNLANPVIVKNAAGEPVLMRLNLFDLGWDAASRTKRIARLKERNVNLNYSADIWEELLQEDVYFYTATTQGGNLYTRGWLDPTTNDAFRRATYSGKPLLNGAQIIRLIFTEPLYSQILLHPPKESDLYRVYGIDEGVVNADPQLRAGGATLDSIVALQNRELQLIPSLYGKNDRFIWRTFDFNKDDVDDKSVLEAFAGTAKHDGREIIGSLPNGLHWFYLANGAGEQVAVVPQAIAIDQRSDPKLKLKDRSVINAYKCVSCHVDGINPFVDVVSASAVKPGIGLGIFKVKAGGGSKTYGSDLKETIEEYYLSKLHDKVALQSRSYVATVKACNGLTTEVNAAAVNEVIESYVYDLVTPEQAAREIGMSLIEAKAAWRGSGNPYLVLLSGDVSIRRVAWERSLKDALLIKVYPWDPKK